VDPVDQDPDPQHCLGQLLLTFSLSPKKKKYSYRLNMNRHPNMYGRFGPKGTEKAPKLLNFALRSWIAKGFHEARMSLFRIQIRRHMSRKFLGLLNPDPSNNRQKNFRETLIFMVL
jgi:hypothetical protein